MGLQDNRAKRDRRNAFLPRIWDRGRGPDRNEIPTFRIDTFDEANNDEAMRLELDLIDEKRLEAFSRLVAQKRKVERYYNSKIKR